MTRILAVSSGGGHWEELLLLRDVFNDYDVHFLTTNLKLAHRAGIENVTDISDCNRGEIFSVVKCMHKAFRLVRDLRPDVVISTGAAPGFFCILAGRLFGARTLWIESFANAEKLSMSGRLSARIADACMVQWEHQARPNGPIFDGTLL